MILSFFRNLRAKIIGAKIGHFVSLDRRGNFVDSGYGYDDLRSPLPSGGTNGQVLTKGTGDNVSWKDVPKELPAYTSSDIGKILMIDAEVNLEWLDPPHELPTGGSVGQVLTRGSNNTVEWANAGGNYTAGDGIDITGSVISFEPNEIDIGAIATTGGHASTPVAQGTIDLINPSTVVVSVVDGSDVRAVLSGKYETGGQVSAYIFSCCSGQYLYTFILSGVSDTMQIVKVDTQQGGGGGNQYLHIVTFTEYDADNQPISIGQVCFIADNQTPIQTAVTLNSALSLKYGPEIVPATGEFYDYANGMKQISHMAIVNGYWAFCNYEYVVGSGLVHNAGISCDTSGMFNYSVSDNIVAI